MRFHKSIYQTAFLLITLLGSNSALACKPNAETYDLGLFLRANKEIALVFTGKAVKVISTPKNNGSTAQEVSFNIDTWWKGSGGKTAIVYGSYDNDKGTSCEGAFDFHADEGQEWLIVGILMSDKIVVQPSLSKLLINGKLTPDHQKILLKRK